MRVSPSRSSLLVRRRLRAKFKTRQLKILALLVLSIGAMTATPVSAQVAGQNVNMVSGTGCGRRGIHFWSARMNLRSLSPRETARICWALRMTIGALICPAFWA